LHQSPLDAFGGIEAAWSLVMKEAKAFMDVLLQLEFSPVLVAYWNRMLYINNRELNVLLPKLDAELSAVDIQRIKSQAHKLIRTMSGDITKSYRALENNSRSNDGKAEVANATAIREMRFSISLN
jgi:glutamyl-tRNA reductase